MKKYMIAALFALVFAVPGMAGATIAPIQLEVVSLEMNPQLGQDILKAAAEQCQYSYQELQGMYDAGTLYIDKVPEGYRVTTADGGLAIIMMEESI